MRRFKASASSTGTRADVFVASKYPRYARSALLKLFDGGLITVNQKNAKPGQKLKNGDSVRVDDSLLSQDIPAVKLNILYEDDDVVVVDKPEGLLSHANGGLNLEASVASFIRAKVAKEMKDGERAGIVHRLDRATSGVMICAKTTLALSYLQKQFQKRKVTKTYLAICQGKLDDPEATVDAPIMRQSGKKSRPFWVSSSGKAAITAYKVEKTENDFFWVKLEPYTGRTHQIRVHMAFLGCPVVGDTLYGGQKAERLMLHAHELAINLPNGQSGHFISPIPKQFNSFWEASVEDAN